MLDPVTLVGMSEGAKKRKARSLFVRRMFAETGTQTTPADEGTRWFHQWCRGLKEVTSMDPMYFDLRAEYRIGERLAPCRYCRGPALYDRCKGWRIAQHIMGGHIRGECVFCRTCAEAKNTLRIIPDDACDGSGVVPARKAKNR